MYPRETVIAEKFEAMVNLGVLNTRMKDFFDIWLLASTFDFNGSVLAEAIAKTFEHRRTKLDAEPVALTATFTAADGTQKQWAAFLRRSQLEQAPRDFVEASEQLRVFLLPIAQALSVKQPFSAAWTAPGPWRVT